MIVLLAVTLYAAAGIVIAAAFVAFLPQGGMSIRFRSAQTRSFGNVGSMSGLPEGGRRSALARCRTCANTTTARLVSAAERNFAERTLRNVCRARRITPA